MWGIVGLAYSLSNPPKKPRKKRSPNLPKAQVSPQKFLDAVRLHSQENNIIFGEVKFPILGNLLKKTQLTEQDAVILGKYFRQIDWLTDSLHIMSIIYKLTMWNDRARYWWKENGDKEKEKEEVFRLRR